MKVGTFFYTLKQGCKNILRNKMFSIASIITMAACIFLFGIFFSIVNNFQSVVKNVESDVMVSVYFNDGVTDDQIQQIGTQIENMKDLVSKTEYVSAEQAWQEYQETYWKDNPEAAETFQNDNPLAGSAHYNVYMKDVSQQAELVTQISAIDGVNKVNESTQAANVLTDFNKLIAYVSVAIIAILICVAVFLISNTVNTGITVRKEEIKIMKLIGATDFMVRAPFIVEGVLIGLIGSIIPLAVLYALYGKVIGYVADKFRFLDDMLSFIPVNSIFKILLPVGLILGVGIGYVGSRVTLRRHLHV